MLSDWYILIVKSTVQSRQHRPLCSKIRPTMGVYSYTQEQKPRRPTIVPLMWPAGRDGIQLCRFGFDPLFNLVPPVESFLFFPKIFYRHFADRENALLVSNSISSCRSTRLERDRWLFLYRCERTIDASFRRRRSCSSRFEIDLQNPIRGASLWLSSVVVASAR
jgi:hypothetical protein